MARLLLLVVLLLCSLSAAETPMPALRGKVVLKATKSPYVLSSNAVLGALDTLVVEPGVTIRVKGYVRLLLRGSVQLRGTETKPVRMQSYDSLDTWVGVQFATASRPFLAEYLIVENAFRNSVNNSQGLFLHSRFVNNYYGLWSETSPLLQVKACEFTRNRFALSVVEGAMQLDQSVLSGNIYGINIEKGARIVGSLAQASGNSEADVRDEAAELQSKKIRLQKNLWRRVESGF